MRNPLVRIVAMAAAIVLSGGAGWGAPSLIDIDRAMPPLKARRPARILPANDAKLFAQFVAGNAALKFEDVKGAADNAAFLRIQRYLANLYTGLTVVKTVRVGALVFECIPLDEQPSLREGQAPDTPPGRSRAPGASILGYKDKICPAGTIAFRPSDAKRIARYGTLENFFAKDSRHGRRLGPAKPDEQTLCPPDPQSGSTEPRSTDCFVHHHAVMGQWVYATGLKARLNLWNPKVVSRDMWPDMSLAQTWIVDALPDGAQETLESGWQLSARVDDTLAAPFLYSSQKDPKAECYDIDCAGFVLVTNQLVFAPFAAARYSVAGGRQGTLSIEWRRKPANGNWWLRMNGVWVGYYPASLYQADGLEAAEPYVRTDFGGENTGDNPASWMGSGQYAELGYGRAAFIDGIGYFDAAGAFREIGAPPEVEIYTSEPACYSLDFALPKPRDAGRGRHFYMGGPGLDDSTCADAMTKAARP